MNLSSNTILITGGASGIGLELAEAFLKEGNEVIICGRRESLLQDVKTKYPQLHIKQVDLSVSDERKSFAQWLIRDFPKLNILVNNAGIQREFRVDQDNLAEVFENENEIETNFTAPVHLTFLLLPHLMSQADAAIVNISSGLGLVPLAIMPVYSATKAAMISFTKSLRHQLQNSRVKVFDVVPPIVDTDLDKGARDRRGQTNKGIQPAQVVKETLKAMKADQLDVAVGMVKMLKIGSRITPSGFFAIMNKKAR
ncbi:SDR family oxidoreductase [Dyadobacter arcticus]|uniref:Oxidoreductase n=1 Tax=Dyadobacter arcticus TaxID=1078754 RepID=A0ABX0UUL5_9BACT|nr:SDR family NAD(P)-dependent oxidoreductase [Dyadobacter arcticus]NIJ54621.1 putative oxidoreductase [Dyadobacter arcticus]